MIALNDAGSRQWLQSRTPAPQGNAHRIDLKLVLSIIDRRGLELSERGSLAAGDRQGAVHASLAMATAPIVLV
jgi:hypothetical protein